MHSIQYFRDRSTENAGGCWVWSRHLDKKDYGKMGYQKRYFLAHRAAYESMHGVIPDGMTVDHLCFNPPCVNPAHLRLLTLLENQQNQRSALASHCKAGHEFTPENTYIKPAASAGQRQCRKCNALAAARYKARRTAA